MTVDYVAKVAAIPGVAAAFPEITIPAEPGRIQVVSLGVADYISPYQPEEYAHRWLHYRLRNGRGVREDAGREVVLGSAIAAEFGKTIGDDISLPVMTPDSPSTLVSHTFKIVGIMAPTKSVPDAGAYVSFQDAELLLHESLPAVFRPRIGSAALVTGVNAYGAPGTDLDRLADRISLQIRDAKVVKPNTAATAFRAGGASFAGVTTAAALLALIIGGLSILNTILISVHERTREIGLKRAIGASRSAIAREVMFEATTLGFLGGATGVMLGAAIVFGLTLSAPAAQPQLFLVDPGLLLSGLLFSVGVAFCASLIPARRASRLDPIAALRSL